MKGAKDPVGAAPESFIKGRLEKRWVAAIFAALCVLGVILLAFHLQDSIVPRKGQNAMVQAELGGPDDLRKKFSDDWNLDGILWEWQVYAGIILIAAGSLLGVLVFTSSTGKRMSRAATLALPLLSLVHVAEDIFLVSARSSCLRALPPSTEVRCDESSLARWSFGVQSTSLLLYILLPFTAFIAVTGAVVTVRRLCITSKAGSGQQAIPLSSPENGTRGSESYWVKNSATPSARKDGQLGICLSGGGVRSASFCLGALNALKERRTRLKGCNRRSELERADYLAAVSGGGYIAGALLSILNGKNAIPATEAYRPGSPEFDYLRRHASYVASGFKEWVVAICTVVRGGLVSALFLAAIAYVSGRWVGHFYFISGRQEVLDDPWSWSWAMATPMVILALLSAASWMLAVHFRDGPSDPQNSREPLRRRAPAQVAWATGWAAAILFLAAVVIPVASWAGQEISEWRDDTSNVEAAVSGAVTGTVGLIAGLSALWANHRSEVIAAMKRAQRTLKWHELLGEFGKRAIQWIAVYGGLSLVACAYLLFFGMITATTSDTSPAEPLVIDWGYPDLPISFVNSVLVTVAVTLVLLLFYVLIDETYLGLHPFYRARLAHTFAVYRDQDKALPRDRQHAAWSPLKGIRFGGEQGVFFPQVLFCASAHSSTPEGGKSLSFTFSADCIGGPGIGWIDTSNVEQVAKRYERDMTVETAMAVSGAAFSSAMGRYGTPADVLLALTNARLGTWIPNPDYLKRPHQWYEAPLPRKRRMSYLLREIIGYYPEGHPLVFVTDGAHYDYLGLVELFRHRCTEIYCFDASTDRESFAASLSESIALAYEELGVEVTLENPEAARPHGGGGATQEEWLNAKIADTPLITATFRYPSFGPKAGASGTLVVGKATLDGHTPWEVRRYAAQHRLFPYDATGDQFFDAAKFDAYTTLGHHVGTLAAREMAKRLGSRTRSERVGRGTDSRRHT